MNTTKSHSSYDDTAHETNKKKQRGISTLLQAEASGIQYMLRFDDWCKTLSTRVLIVRQTSKRVEKQDTWLVWEDNRKIHQQVCDKYLQAEAVLMNIYRTVRKADYYAHVFSSPETDRSNLYTEIDPKVFETTATIVSDGNAWTKLKLD
uniref:Uncharacterized protein n=1 Tax=Caenorhabditis japonica TaxID=281687 RepID=A0A8R1HMF9_CAEJA